MPAATKTRLSGRNWSQYNEALVNRGSMTFWFSEEVLDNWRHANGENKRGRPFTYSAIAIETFLTVRELLKFPYRQTEGFLRSLLPLVRPDLDVPDFTSAAKRAASLPVKLIAAPRRGAIHVVIDSTGLKVFGDGEWKVRQHGASKRRTWRKLHIAIDPETQEILAETLTTNGVHDGDQAEPLLDAIPNRIRTVTGDGGYDKWKVYEAIERRDAQPKIPPQHNAKIKRHGNRAEPRLPRDEAIRAIRRVGRHSWKKSIGYHRRSLVETAMFRLKSTFGPTLKNRAPENQSTETRLRCKILNQFARGRPRSTKPN